MLNRTFIFLDGENTSFVQNKSFSLLVLGCLVNKIRVFFYNIKNDIVFQTHISFLKA